MFGRKSILNLSAGCLVLSAALMQFCASAHAGVFYKESWEDGKIQKPTLLFEGNCYKKQAHGYNSLEITKSKVHDGNYAIRAEAHGDDKNNVCSADYLANERKTRNEIRYLSNSDKGRFTQGSEHWFTTSYFFPSNEGSFDSWWADGRRIIIFQLLGGGNSQTPEIHFLLGNKGRLDIEMSSSVTERENLIKSHSSTDIKPDKWVDVVVHWKRSWKSDGLIQIWVDDKLVVNKSGPSSIRDKPYAVAKTGIYLGTDKRPFDYVMYMDNFQIGDSNSNFGKMVATTSAPSLEAAPLPLPPANLKVSVY